MCVCSFYLQTIPGFSRMIFWLAMATHGEPDNCVTSGSGVEGQSQVVVKCWVGWVAVPRYSRSAVGQDSTWSELLFVSICRMLTKYIVSCKPLALSSLWCDESWGIWRPWFSEPAGLPSDVCQFDHCMVNWWVKGISHLPSMWWASPLDPLSFVKRFQAASLEL